MLDSDWLIHSSCRIIRNINTIYTPSTLIMFNYISLALQICDPKSRVANNNHDSLCSLTRSTTIYFFFIRPCFLILKSCARKLRNSSSPSNPSLSTTHTDVCHGVSVCVCVCVCACVCARALMRQR